MFDDQDSAWRTVIGGQAAQLQQAIDDKDQDEVDQFEASFAADAQALGQFVQSTAPANKTKYESTGSRISGAFSRPTWR